MDEKVLRSLIKWPSVPECHGWLALDRRGLWRMRNEYAQSNHLAGEVIKHSGLIEFIGRNYAQNYDGRWFFQNGPQKVFIDLDYTPFVAQIHPMEGGYFLKTTTGESITPSKCWIDEMGHIIFLASMNIQYSSNTEEPLFLKGCKDVHVLLHDHDLEIFSQSAEIQNVCGDLGYWSWQGKKISIEPIHSKDIKDLYLPLPCSRNS